MELKLHKIAIAVLAAVVSLIVAGVAIGATSSGSSSKQKGMKTGRKYVPIDNDVLLYVEGAPELTVKDFVRIAGGEAYRHARAFRGEDFVREHAMEDALRKSLVLREAVARGMDKVPQFAGPQDTIRVAWLGNYYKGMLGDNLVVTENEILAVAPRNWERRAVAEITVPSSGLAEELRKKVLAGEDFAGLASRESISPSAVNGGAIKPTDDPETLPFPEYYRITLFELKKGECTEVFPSSLGSGYAFACVTDISTYSDEEKRQFLSVREPEVKAKKFLRLTGEIEKHFDIILNDNIIRAYSEAPSEAVLAMANGWTLTKSYYENYLTARAAKVPSSPEEMRDQLSKIAAERCYYDLAVKTGLEASEAFHVAYREYFENQLYKSVVDELLARIKITNDQARKFYNENRATIRQDLAVKAKAVVVKDKKVAKRVLSLLKDRSIGFEDAVAEYTIDKEGKRNGGDIGVLSENGKPVREVFRRALGLKVGEFGGPYEEDGKYYILTVEQRQERKQLTFEDSSKAIMERLTDIAKKDAIEAEMTRLKKKYKYRIEADLLKRVDIGKEPSPTSGGHH